MSSNTAEPVVAPQASNASLADSLTQRVGADDARAVAVRDVWRALWTSRLVVWIAGAGTVAAFGLGPARHALNPVGLTRGLGRLGDVLAAPAARWDAAWYLVIAHYGYRPDLGSFTGSRTAFFPLYPLGVRALSDLGLEPVIAGVLLSLAALAAGLYCLHRLMTLEVTRLRLPSGGETARLVVLLSALAPMAFYFSAIYSESLYLALSLGVFLCARRGRWASAAGFGALAAATRSNGVVLLVPLLLLYLYGPREDRDPDYATVGRSSGAPVEGATRGLAQRAPRLRRLPRPCYRLRADVLWLALVPVGLGLYMGHLALAGGDALAPFHAEAAWSRHFAGPFGGIWDGAKAAFEGARQLLSSQRHHAYYPAAGGSPFIDAGHNLMLFAFLIAAIPATIGVLRLLPGAYGIYVLAALVLPLSYPVASQPLMSLPRFLVVLFPLNMWLAVRLAARPRALAHAVLIVSGLALAFFAAEFSTWHWVA
jgi:Mannosyltransferase (PIG-V)